MKRKILIIANFILIVFVIFSLIFCTHQNQQFVFDEVNQFVNSNVEIDKSQVIKKGDGDLIYVKPIRIIFGSLAIICLLIVNVLLVYCSEKIKEENFKKIRRIVITILEIIAILFILFFVSFCYRIRKNYDSNDKKIENTEDVMFIENIEPPFIKVHGNFDENLKMYIGKIEIEIRPNENGDSVFYKLGDAEYKELLSNENIKVNDEEIIYVYSEDSNGNKSDVIGAIIKHDKDIINNQVITDLDTSEELENNNNVNINNDNNNSNNDNKNNFDNNDNSNNSNNIDSIQKKINLENAEVKLSQDVSEYIGIAQEPTVNLEIDGKNLQEGIDYEVEYKDNTDAGIATVIIKGKGAYEGSIEKSFEIKKLELVATYEGEEIFYGETPKLNVKVSGFINSETIETAKDFVFPTIKYEEKTVGIYELVPQGGSAKNYTFKYVPGNLVVKTKKITSENLKVELEKNEIEFSEIEYNGIEQEPELNIGIDSKVLIQGEDYDIEYKNNIQAGIGTAIITGKGDYEGVIEYNFEIQRAKLIATYEGEEITYGEMPILDVAVKGFVNGENPYNIEGFEFPVVIPNSLEAGEYELVPQGGVTSENYVFKYVPGILKINPKKLTKDNSVITLSQEETSYTGGEQKPQVTIVVDGKELVEGKDFEVEYKDNIDAGTATVIIKGKGDYEGSIETNFEIQKMELTAIYEGEEIIFGETPKLEVKVEGFINGETVETVKDFEIPTIKYEEKSVGTYELIPEGGSAKNYTFKYVSGNLVIKGKTLTQDNTKIEVGNDDIIYDGTEQKPPVTIIVDGKELVEGEDFEVEYKDNTEPGTATVVITGKGDYEGTIETTFEIKKAKLTAKYEGEEIYYAGIPKLEVKVEGFLNGDTAENVLGYIIPTITNMNTELGSYELTPEGGAIEDPHYEFEYVSGILKIVPKELSTDGIVVDVIDSTFIYTGTELESQISVNYNGVLLYEGTDYTVEYKNNVDAGLATIEIIGKGNYSGSISKTFEIVKAELTAKYEGEIITFGETPKLKVKVEGFLNGETEKTAKGFAIPTVININEKAGQYELFPQGGDAKNYTFTYLSGYLQIVPKQITSENTIITIESDKIEYTGTEQTPPIKIVVDGKELVQGEDFDVEYKDNIVPGTATIVITGKGDYEGSLEKTFAIEKAMLTVTYEGETVQLGQLPNLSLKVEGFVNGENAETTSGYVAPTIINTNTEIGTYELTPEGGSSNNYDFTYVSGNLVIEPIRLSSENLTITVNQSEIKYDGTEQTPPITVVYDGKTLEEGKDFTVEYKNNTNAGEATIIVTGKGDYQCQVETRFVIEKSELTVTYLGETIKYGETPKFPLKVEGFVEGDTIENALEYESPIVENPNAPVGSYELTPVGGNATNYNFKYVSGILTVEIKKLSLEEATITIPEVRYNGAPQTPPISIEIDGKTLVQDIDFTVEYLNNQEIGTANVKITGIGNYEGSLETNFEIKKAILTVTYLGETIELGQIPNLELVISGFIGVDSPDTIEGYVAPTITNRNTALGSYELTPTGGSSDKYEFQYVSGTLVIEPKHLTTTNATITINESEIKYDGKEQKPSITLEYNGQILEEGKDFTVEYLNNINAGEATIRVTGKGDYQGIIETKFQIEKAILTVTYLGEIINYQEIPNLEFTISGFVNGENENTASGFVMPVIENTNTAVGTYTLVPVNGAADNYTFNYVAGTLVIEAHVPYIVEYYTENLDGTYSLNQTENLTGPKNRTVNANKIEISGFEYASNNENNVESGTVLADGSLTLELYYDLINYDIKYNLNNGIVNGENPSKYTILTEDITLINPTKEYHVFTGWTGTDINTPEQNVIITKGSTSNREYTANWEEYSYKVKFDGNGATGGSMEDMANIAYSSVVNLTQNGYTREECKFLNWNTKADGTGDTFVNEAQISKLTDVNGAEITLYAQWEDIVAPVWTCTNVTNTNVNYSNYANSDDTITLTITGTDANYLSNSLTMEKIDVCINSTTVMCSTNLTGPIVIGNGVQYTLTISGIQGNGDLSVKIAENTILDQWNNTSIETNLGTGVIIDNIAPNSPTIVMSANGGLYSSDYYYQNSATYTITSGNDSATNLIGNEAEGAWGIVPLGASDSIDKTTYIVNGVVTTAETIYSSAVEVAPSAASGSCTVTAYTYDKAGNKSQPASVSNNICGNHNKALNSQKSAETCTAAEVRDYRCSDCYITNGTYNGKAALGHNYPCSGTNHKRSGGSVTIICSRCTTTKKYTVTNGTCTSWSCSCGSKGGTSTHASGSYSYADGTYHSYKCSRCAGTVSAKHTHSSWSAQGSYHYHYCGTCKHTYGSAISHTMGWSKTSTSHSYKCNTCGYTTTAGNHVFTTYTGYKKCNTCGYTTGT